VVEGLLKALADLRRVIEMIQQARDAASARASLQVHLDLSERQADAVLSMPLRRLTGLEQESLGQEAERSARERDQRVPSARSAHGALLDAMVAEFKALKKRFATPAAPGLWKGAMNWWPSAAAPSDPTRNCNAARPWQPWRREGRLLIQADGAVKVVTPQVLGTLHLDQPSGAGGHPSPAQLILPVQQQAPGAGLHGRWPGGSACAGNSPASNPATWSKFLPDSLDGGSVVQVLALPAMAPGRT
jgi:DNA gyrase subunit A